MDVLNGRSSDVAWLAGWLLSLGCVPDVDDDITTVAEPRILALRSTPAEAPKGTTVRLEALIATPSGEVSPDVAWSACLVRKPLTDLGPINPACLSPRAAATTALPLGVGAAVDLVIPELACGLFGSSPPPPKDDEPSGRPADPDPTGGYYQPIVAFLGDEPPVVGGVRLDCGLYGAGREQTVEFRTRYRPNEHPRIASLTASGAEVVAGATEPLEVRPGEAVALRAEWAPCPRQAVCGDAICSSGEDATACALDCTPPAVGCSGAETYAWFDAQARVVKDRRETVTVSWFATDGTFETRRTGVTEADRDEPFTPNEWTAPPEGGDVQMWLVIRDDRGGVAFETYAFRVTE